MEVSFPSEAPQESGEAETHFAPMEWLGGLTLVHVTCSTGRRHQVRVHMAHLGHPLAGDDLYGGRPLDGNEGAFLHAARLELLEEGTQFEAPLPGHRQELLLRLGATRLEPPKGRITLTRPLV
jgi:23S rRNA pseudouridine1911/1915/1917 synthase